MRLTLFVFFIFSTPTYAITAKLVSTTANGFWFPVINNGRILFRGADNTLRLINGNSETVIVRNGDPAPSGGTFINVNNNTGIDLDKDGVVAFVGETTHGYGIYRYQNGIITTVAAYGTLIPSSHLVFESFYQTSVAIDNGVIVFTGFARVQDRLLYGVYKHNGTVLSKVVDYSDLRPDGLSTYDVTFQGVDIDNGKIVFYNGSGSFGIIYRYETFPNQTVPLITPLAQIGQTIPNTPCVIDGLDVLPSSVNGEIALFISTGVCQVETFISQLVLSSTTQQNLSILRVAIIGNFPNSYDGSVSIDGNTIVSETLSPGGSKIILEENGLTSTILSEDGVVDNNGNVIKPVFNGYVFGDRGLSNRKIVFYGRFNDIQGIIELDIDGVGSLANSRTIPALHGIAFYTLVFSLAGILISRIRLLKKQIKDINMLSNFNVT
ncbi:MAG: hypothetical protein CTY18_05220 [Methylomonas sp.]|uniref:DUF7453 family protein n=1 Tax=Flavobacterium sp. TaxID=239 RepID=UPI000D2E7C61|nr:hypothetical protein [Flavobacterium sp.]MBA4155742.1 hypothetical protein [Flavobacterium sp.]PPD17974.1 MAG: hypothetical protein CTY24_13860 [Methylobacter sp.]PPD36240.1 MAG: hypothetical protein CTY18_05220 [Methylomonas sp.]